MKVSHVPVRFPEIDIARGVAVVMMVVFHTAFDLRFLGIVPLAVSSGFFRILALATASIFLFLVGVSLSISASHAATRLDRKGFVQKYLVRGAVIVAIGMGITLLTWIIIPSMYIRFGILHLIGFSVMASPLYSRYGWPNLVLGAVCIALGPVMAGISGTPLLLWSGIHPAAFASVDYTPVFPWMGFVFIGVFAGSVLYPLGERRAGTSSISCSPLEFLGRHSLAIYLIHQPVIIAALLLLFPVSVGLPPSLPGA